MEVAVVGWLAADQVDQNDEPWSTIDMAALSYGEPMNFKFKGTELTAESSIYRVVAKKL